MRRNIPDIIFFDLLHKEQFPCKIFFADHLGDHGIMFQALFFRHTFILSWNLVLSV